MNELLQKHGCSNVFTVPEGLKELMADISREVLREQPPNIFDFITNYLSALLITREHGVLAVTILDDLCDCRPTVSEYLLQFGMESEDADDLAQVIKEEIEGVEPVEGKEKVKEFEIIKKILNRKTLDEDMTAKVCQVARNAYRDYWYRKKYLEQRLKLQSDQPWEIAAKHTLELYKRTKPSFSELSRATQRIQAAYRGYHVRRNLLSHLKPKKKPAAKVELPGPPLDIAASREIELGPVIDIKVKEDNVTAMFDEHEYGDSLGLMYDPMKTITHVVDEDEREVQTRVKIAKSYQSRIAMDVTTRERRDSELIEAEPILEPSKPSSTARPRASFAPTTTERIILEDEETPHENEEEPVFVVGDRQSEVMKSGVSFTPSVGMIKSDEALTLDDEEVKKSVITIVEDVEVLPVTEDVELPLEGGTDVAQEVPEDITAERTDEDVDSQPTASVPSSEPDTGNTTEVEDATDAGVSSEAEEG